MSDTPRTDTNKHALDHLERYGYENSLDDPVVEWPILCEEIEHELTKAKEQRDRLAEEVENLRAAQIHTCHDQCQKPMCVMRRQRDRLAEALESLMYGHEVIGEWERCEQALAAVKGGTP
jgi:hypothetical protein